MYAKGCASIACLMGLLVPASAGGTDTFAVPLDGLLGHYTTDTSLGSLWKKCAYDFGTPFLEVQEVRIRIAGTFYGGLWVPDFPFFEPLPWDAVTSRGFFSVLYPEALRPGVDVAGLDCSGAFDIEAVYDHISMLEWERVKQGWGEVSLEINQPYFWCWGDPYIQVEHATGDVTQAVLTVEGTPVPGPAVLPGDATGDDVVDGADYTVWADNYQLGGVAPFSEGGRTVGNFNEDTVVDGADYTIWADHFGDSLSGAAAAPEPVTTLWILLGALPMLGRRSRH